MRPDEIEIAVASYNRVDNLDIVTDIVILCPTWSFFFTRGGAVGEEASWK